MLGSPVSLVQTVAAPIGGWNARDAVQAMPITDAPIMDNWVPGQDGVALRPGYQSHVTGLGANAESLMTHSAPSGTRTLFAASGTSIYDVSTAGPVGAADVTGLTSARFIHTMFATSGGNFLVICNGADSVRNYSGSAWTTPSITGVTSANLSFVTAHVSRLWFIEKNTLNNSYLGTSSIAGSATKIDVGPLCKRGGSLVALGSWTRDGGSGPDDIFVAVTNEGEVLIYSGTDPSSSDTWGLVGVFRVPQPIGSRCLVKIGADLVIITSRGILPLSAVLATALSQQQYAALTDKIGPAFEKAYRSDANQFGWQVIEYPKAGLLFVNVPDSTNSRYVQFVQNTRNGAWCRFTDINALCWGALGDALYFAGNDANIYKYDVDYDDDGDAIVASALTAFTDCGTQANKRFLMAQASYSAIENTTIPIALKLDFDTSVTALSLATVENSGAAWDTVEWDSAEAVWGLASQAINRKQGIRGIGQNAAIYVGVSAKSKVVLNNFDILYENGTAF